MSSMNGQRFMSVAEGELSVYETIAWRGGYTDNGREGNFSEMTIRTGSIDEVTITDANVGRVVVTPRGNSTYAVRDPFPSADGSNRLRLNLSSTEIGVENLAVESVTSLSTGYVGLENGNRVPSASGSIQFTAANGDSALLELLKVATPNELLPLNIYGNERVRYTISHQGVQYELSKPSGSLYIPWYSN